MGEIKLYSHEQVKAILVEINYELLSHCGKGLHNLMKQSGESESPSYFQFIKDSYNG